MFCVTNDIAEAIVAKTDEKALAAVEEELKKNPSASLDELWAKAKQASPGVGRLDRRQFNARYPLQVKRRLLQAAGGKRKRRRGRKAKAAAEAPARRRLLGRPRGRPRKAASSGDSTSSAARDAVREALLGFASDVVSAADSPKQLIKVLSGVDSYVDRVTKALG